MNTDGPPLKTPMIEESQICYPTLHSNGIKRKSVGQKELLKLDPCTFVSIIGAVSPGCRNEVEGVLSDVLETMETSESSQTTRRRARRLTGGSPVWRSTINVGERGRRRTSTTGRRRNRGNHVWLGQNGVTRKKAPEDWNSLSMTRGMSGIGGKRYAILKCQGRLRASKCSAVVSAFQA